jgi:HCOMODA/2-hydroxy-3-carboxy-muconic semialdehyde decarboxylase
LLIEDLVAANRILAQEGVLDGWGHVSVRHDRDPGRYLLSRSLAPELVSAEDILEFDLDNAPVEVMERDLHTHAPPVIPFGVVNVLLQPMYHRAAFISLGVPVFEIRDAAGITDMLIRDPALGHALAKSIADKPAVLMRGHGATVVGPSIPRVVARSIFLALNAKLQAQAMIMVQGGAINYLDPAEARLIEAREGYGLGRAWKAWKRRALKQP